MIDKNVREALLSDRPSVDVPIRNTYWRFVVLVLSCVVVFATSFAQTNPDSIEIRIMSEFDLSHMQYNQIGILYSVAFIPGCCLAGYLIDLMGNELSVALFTAMAILGTSLEAYFISNRQSFAGVLLGRAIFGFGAAGGLIWYVCVVSVWFFYLDTAYAAAGFVICSSLGSLMADVATPIQFRAKRSISDAVWLPVYVYAVAFFAIIGVNLLQKRVDKERKFLKYIDKAQEALSNQIMEKDQEESEEKDLTETVTNAISQNKALLEQINSRVNIKRSINLRRIKSFSASFWLLCVIGFFERLTVGAFLQDADELYMSKYNFGLQEAGLVLAIPHFLLIVFAVPIAYFLNKFGKRCYFLILGFFFIMLGHAAFYTAHDCLSGDKCLAGILPMTLLAAGEAFILLTVFTSVTYTVPERYFGTAFGVQLAVSELGYLIGSVIVGEILDAASPVRVEFYMVNLTLLVLSGFGLLLTVILAWHDERTKGILNAVIVEGDIDSDSDSRGSNLVN